MNRKTKRHYIILTGFFSFRTEILKKTPIRDLAAVYRPWFTRLGFSEAKATLTEHYVNYFYSSFQDIAYPEMELNSLFFGETDSFPPGEKMLEDCRTKLFENRAKVLKLTRQNPFTGKNINLSGKADIPFIIDYIDYSFYPEGTGIFSLKVRLTEEKPDITLISDFLHQVRTLDNRISIEVEENKQLYSVKDFINREILVSPEHTDLFFPLCATDFNNKLKAYTTVELQNPLTGKKNERTVQNLLYDLGTVSPVGSAGSEGFLAPTDRYHDHLIDNNCLSIFKNWCALSLFDTYTTLITSEARGFGIYEISEIYYYPIYIHNLYQKLSLFNFNSTFSCNRGDERKNRKLRDDFICFRNAYDLSDISFNFLPDLINQQMNRALGIEKEIIRMEERVEKIHAFIQEKQDSRTNIILAVLSIVSFAEMLFGASRWFLKMMRIPEAFHSAASIGFTGLMLITIFLALFCLRKKN